MEVPDLNDRGSNRVCRGGGGGWGGGGGGGGEVRNG